MLMLSSSGCAVRQRNPVPEHLVMKAQIPELDDVRIPAGFNIDDPEGPIYKLKRIIKEAQRQAAVHTRCCQKELIELSLSGGGADGAFGAGLLCGWTMAGTRPEFDIVTGISTGALQAPFAFLGADYDKNLKVYAAITNKDVFKKRVIFEILQRGDAVADFSPLANLIARLFGEKELEAVAREHARGRRLFIGTTHFDAQVPVFWDMGAIASSGHPKAPEIFRKVMLASASIPFAVSPVYFEVEAEGKRYEEMHVDGGVMTQVFGAKYLVFAAKAWLEEGYTVSSRLYIIRNSHLNPEYRFVEAKIPEIGKRAVSTLIKTQGLGDIYRAYLDTSQAGIDFNYIDIPLDFKIEPKEEFDPAYMKALYEVGYQMARNGVPWGKYPPGFTSK
jgi:hypothetical protein